MTRTVVALFDDFSSANDAVRDLVNNGYSRDDLSMVANDAEGKYGQYLSSENKATMDTSATSEGAGVGAGIGAVLGGIGGLLIGLGALAIPGIGPVIAAGPLAAALTGLAGAGVGAVAGGVTGGIIGALVDLGVPEESAQYYAEGVRRGGTLVTVRTADDMTDRAVDILNSHNPVDINKRSTQWRESGWTRFDPNAPAYSARTTAGTMAAGTTMGETFSGNRPEMSTVDFTNYDTDFRHHFDTGNECCLGLLGHDHTILQHTVQAVAHADFCGLRLDMDITGFVGECLPDDHIH
jgi:hypothetical protein